MEDGQLSVHQEQSEVVEAQQWIVNHNGLVELVANSTHNGGDLWRSPMKCS